MESPEHSGTKNARNDKSSSTVIENTASPSRYATPLPDCLLGRSPEELKAVERSMVRKLDLKLLPLLIIMFLMNILDRNNYTNARLGGLEEDIGLNDHQYQTALMIMYVGYLLMQYPSNIILSKFPRPGLYLAVTMMLWGLISTCMAAAHSYAAVFSVRFFLGFVEAPFFSGAALLLSSWYSKAELPSRYAWLFAGNTIANALGGLVAAGVLSGMEGVQGIRAWRWLFILEGKSIPFFSRMLVANAGGAGIITITIAIVAAFILPNYPGKAMFLTEEEREYAVWRLKEDAGGVADYDEESIWAGGLQALKDPKVYILILMEMCLLVGMSFTYFFPTIVKTLGYGEIETLLLSTPPYFLGFFAALWNSYHSGRVNDRCFHIVVPLSISMLGNILCCTLTSTAGRYTAMFLMAVGVYSAFSTVLAWVSSSIHRPKAKRGAALALVGAFGNLTHTFTSYLFPNEDAPQYRTGGITLAVFCGVCALTALTLRLILQRENRRLDREEGWVEHAAEDGKPRLGTRGFRYTT